jgi:hypothetical protein
MIRVTCLNCGSILNAKDSLAGQERKCPTCQQPILIVADEAAGQAAARPAQPGTGVHVAGDAGLPLHHLPDRLDRSCHYLICDKTHLMAFWQNDGHGWMFRAGTGFASAKRSRDNLPSEGDFQLIELKFVMAPEGKRLSGLVPYQLATRWALTVLHEGDDQIVGKITDIGGLNRDQKFAVRQALKEHFMRDVWADSAEVLEYLGNAERHAPRMG